MGEAGRPQLFVSHHSSKYEVALHVERALSRHGVECWIAPRDVGPGEAFDTAIMKAIRDSSGVLLLFCSQSDKSPHVKRELILADSAHKAIIPLRLEEIVPDDLAYHLASAQWIDWLEKRDDSIARIAVKAQQLAGVPPVREGAPVIPGGASAVAADNLHAAILSQAAETPPPAPASVSVRTLVMAGLGVAVVVLAAMLFLRGGEAPKTEVAASTQAPAATPSPPAAAPPAPGTGDTPVSSPVAAPSQHAATPATPQAADASAPVRSRIPPTFNCNRAITNSERRICASDELAALDREMAEAYRALNQIAINRGALLTAEQSAWRVSVRDACPDDACVARVMRQRIAVLVERRLDIAEKRAEKPATGY